MWCKEGSSLQRYCVISVHKGLLILESNYNASIEIQTKSFKE